MNILDDIWYIAAYSDEITNKPLGRIVCGLPMVIFRGASGKVSVLEDRCPHRQAPLSLGEVIGENIQCGYHGFIINQQGECIHIPRQDNIPTKNQIKSFTSIERWGFIWVWWGNEQKADTSLIPELPWTEDNNRRVKYFHFDVKANHQLMADNLLDVSHVDFLHKNSIASKIDPTAKEDKTPKVTIDNWTEGNTVHNLRKVYNTKVAGITAQWAGTEGPLTRISTSRWEPPNSCITKLQFADQNEQINQTINLDHIFTPETNSTCHYFMAFAWDFGGPDGYPTHDDVDREQRDLIGSDDIPMVEAQQLNLDRFGKVQDIPVKQDRNVVSVHKVLQKLFKELGKEIPNEIQRMRT